MMVELSKRKNVTLAITEDVLKDFRTTFPYISISKWVESWMKYEVSQSRSEKGGRRK